jgi:protein-disulfide isomerase
MKIPIADHALRAAALVGLGASTLLHVEYSGPASLCAVGGGCDAVRNSGYAELLGIPMPVLGILFFALVLGVATSPGQRRWLLPIAAAGAVIAGLLIVVQGAVLGAFCWMCVIVDVSALLVGGFAFTLRDYAPVASARSAAVQAAIAVVVAVGAIGLHGLISGGTGEGTRGGDVPLEVALHRLQGRVALVEFLDFECPACRAMHAELAPVLSEFAGRVTLVVKHLPLPQHAHAADAARAFSCAREQGKGPEMAERLFAAERLTAENCYAIADELGLGRDEFRSCVNSQRTTQRLLDHLQTARGMHVTSLPTYWIGDRRFEGVRDSEQLRASLGRAWRELQ